TGRTPSHSKSGLYSVWDIYFHTNLYKYAFGIIPWILMLHIDTVLNTHPLVQSLVLEASPTMYIIPSTLHNIFLKKANVLKGQKTSTWLFCSGFSISVIYASL